MLLAVIALNSLLKVHRLGENLHMSAAWLMLLLCSCVCVRAWFVFQRIKSHTELLTWASVTDSVWPALPFAGAFQLSRAQARLAPCRSRHLAFHSRSQPLSGLQLYRGEARILRISCQGQARELQGPDCLSKRTSFQSDWTSSAKTYSKYKRPSGKRLRPRGLGRRQPSRQRCVRWKHAEPDLPQHPLGFLSWGICLAKDDRGWPGFQCTYYTAS